MAQDSAWEELLSDLDSFQRHLGKSRSTNVSDSSSRNRARSLVQLFFRLVRPALEALGLDNFDQIDYEFQVLLSLANRVSRRSTYVGMLKDIRSSLEDIEAQRELAIGVRSVQPFVQGRPYVSEGEQRIVDTLRNLVPSAALSYRQALDDLGTSNRHSYGGTAAELREALREVLDHLAPDAAVTGAAGFKFEKEKTQPTMRQKVHFILNSRGRTESARQPAEGAAGLVDELTASLVRSVYVHASLSTHVAPTVGEVRRVKTYVDTILIDLLEI